MLIAKLYIETTVQTVLTVMELTESESDVEARVALDFGVEPDDVKLAESVVADGVIKALYLNPGDSFVDG